jgi:hypothetical protein
LGIRIPFNNGSEVKELVLKLKPTRDSKKSYFKLFQGFQFIFNFQKSGSGGSFGSYKIKEPPKTLLLTISLREELAMIKPLETRNWTTLVTTSVGWLSVMEPDNQKEVLRAVLKYL